MRMDLPSPATVRANRMFGPSCSQTFVLTADSFGIGPYCTFCQAFSVALDRVTTRSLKANVTADVTAATRNSGAST
jgi:hypothetical protein